MQLGKSDAHKFVVDVLQVWAQAAFVVKVMRFAIRPNHSICTILFVCIA